MVEAPSRSAVPFSWVPWSYRADDGGYSSCSDQFKKQGQRFRKAEKVAGTNYPQSEPLSGPGPPDLPLGPGALTWHRHPENQSPRLLRSHGAYCTIVILLLWSQPVGALVRHGLWPTPPAYPPTFPSLCCSMRKHLAGPPSAGDLETDLHAAVYSIPPSGSSASPTLPHEKGSKEVPASTASAPAAQVRWSAPPDR